MEWSKDEIELLKKHYFSSSWDKIKRLLPNRTKTGIQHKAQRLKLTRKHKRVLDENGRYVKISGTEIPKDIFKKVSILSEKLSIPESRLISEAVAEYLSKRGYFTEFTADKDAIVLDSPPNSWTEEMINLYAAAWVDTEGWLGIIPRSHPNNLSGIQYIPGIQIVNTVKEPLIIIQKALGGYIYQSKRRYKGEIRKYWAWSCRVEKIPYILRKIYPYLIVKRKNAELLLSYFEKYPRKKRQGLPSHNIERFKFLDSIYRQIRKKPIKITGG